MVGGVGGVRREFTSHDSLSARSEEPEARRSGSGRCETAGRGATRRAGPREGEGRGGEGARRADWLTGPGCIELLAKTRPRIGESLELNGMGDGRCAADLSSEREESYYGLCYLPPLESRAGRGDE